MQKFTTHTGTGIPLRRNNIDTDQIIPSRFLKRVSRSGFEDALFAEWRKDPDFILNTAPYSGGSILVAGTDFGIGSSREHAVWGLLDYGIRVVVSARFADIFRGNSGKAGLLTVQVSEDDVDRLWDLLDREPQTDLLVDLSSQTITTPESVIKFDVDPYVKWRLEMGYDDISLTEQHADRIEAYERRRPGFLPDCRFQSA
ncbi:3-isopropylmalate dehydratase small subunit [Arthrobacter sp. VKM Ac-2550]|uniref:3-isopropylmalate dehydratase small subunit n=1 Tax=Crystallibacter permensis TaxID=1938888 RepID=UPI0022276D81|nr:3-isopropylmalate dehydratase small subunit [Arthrobacter sp. VKM Ac-2550]MCW2135091.1 3-isopropylmalate dehydratase, small subunit [Arthrobacter sp. VKM Ac-2550]